MHVLSFTLNILLQNGDTALNKAIDGKHTNIVNLLQQHQKTQ